MIEVRTWRDPGPRGSRGAAWIAECTVDGRPFRARSRSGAPNELARQLVAAGIADQPMEIFDTDRGIQTLSYASFHEAAKWTYTEGNRPLQRVRWQPRPENFDAGLSGKPQDGGESPADVPEEG